MNAIIIGSTTILDERALTGAIKGIKTASAKLDAAIHQAAVSGLYHFGQCGDSTPLAQLAGAFGKAHRRSAYISWVMTFSPLVWHEDKTKGSGVFKKKQKGDVNALDVEKAEATPFWTEKEKTPKAWNAESALAGIRAMLATAMKSADKHQTEKGAEALKRFTAQLLKRANEFTLLADEPVDGASTVTEILSALDEPLTDELEEAA